LRRSNPDFEQLREALENARKRGTPVLVTETINEHEIIHVQPVVQPARRRR
jgi:IS5 family transposase